MTKEIKLNKIPNILLDVYLNGIYQGTINESESMDLQKQIIENQISGYSYKINSDFYHLFDEKLKIEGYEIFIDLSGECIDWLVSSL